MTTQLLIGNGLQLTAALANGSDGNATYYNVNTVDGAGRQDLSRDLFTSESSTAEGSQADPATGLKPTVLTTSFIKSSDTGVDHEINVKFHSEHTDDPSTADLVDSAYLDTSEGAYFFRLRLKKNDKLVAYRIVPVSAESVSAANAGGAFTQTVSAAETFQLVDDKGVDITGGTLHYDPSQYTMDVRLYKANSAGDNVLAFGGYGTDTKIDMEKADIKISVKNKLNIYTYASEENISIRDGSARFTVNGSTVERKVDND